MSDNNLLHFHIVLSVVGLLLVSALTVSYLPAAILLAAQAVTLTICARNLIWETLCGVGALVKELFKPKWEEEADEDEEDDPRPAPTLRERYGLAGVRRIGRFVNGKALALIFFFLLSLGMLGFYIFSVVKCDGGYGNRNYCHVARIIEFLGSNND